MGTKKHLIKSRGFQRTNSKCCWIILGAIALFGSWPVAQYGDTSPWLIAIPLGYGVFIGTALNLIRFKGNPLNRNTPPTPR